jgi:hypothetical protein
MWQRLLPLAVLVGCSSSSTPGAVKGTIRGNDYPVVDSISAILTSFGDSAAMIVLSSSTDVCLPPDAQIQHPGETTLVIVLQDGNAAPTATGTYTAFDPSSNAPPPAKLATLYTSILTAACTNNADDQTAAVSGSVTLTSVGGGVYAGHFDVVLDSGDHITGTFNPTACGQLPAELKSQTPPACKP